MLDHVTIGVNDIERSMRFYDSALRPLGIARLYGDGDRFAGYGVNPKAFFWIGNRDQPANRFAHRLCSAMTVRPSTGFTRQRSRPAARIMVDREYGKHYDPDYYGAFVLDPDGHNIEAVCRLPEKG